ncbi:hypothetical protein [Flavobacterium cerinum]|uniref:Cardiolipin synthase N-terminal domain-containing protein n=1 Tax=Flavobacterium cerinum TaxID=2502784 RepID=A0ABY5IT20_9FLAO|nr:hypothetical protein [Flavobacterium cerinum]UUC45425.1 hypothetical protein NOX80_17605 [Flavobacterium cerinum]
MKLKKNTLYLLLLLVASFLALFIGKDFQLDPQYNWVYTGMKYLAFALLFMAVFASVSNTREMIKSTELKPKALWIILSMLPILFCLVVFILSSTVYKLKLF